MILAGATTLYPTFLPVAEPSEPLTQLLETRPPIVSLPPKVVSSRPTTPAIETRSPIMPLPPTIVVSSRPTTPAIDASARYLPVVTPPALAAPTVPSVSAPKFNPGSVIPPDSIAAVPAPVGGLTPVPAGLSRNEWIAAAAIGVLLLLVVVKL